MDESSVLEDSGGLTSMDWLRNLHVGATTTTGCSCHGAEDGITGAKGDESDNPTASSTTEEDPPKKHVVHKRPWKRDGKSKASTKDCSTASLEPPSKVLKLSRSESGDPVAKHTNAWLEKTNETAACPHGASATVALLRTEEQLKPPYSYPQLITFAISQSSNKQLLVSEIYDWIKRNFAFYRNPARRWRWQAQIRQTLTTNECFIKGDKPKKNHGRGYYWKLSHVVDGTVRSGKKGLRKNSMKKWPEQEETESMVPFENEQSSAGVDGDNETQPLRTGMSSPQSLWTDKIVLSTRHLFPDDQVTAGGGDYQSHVLDHHHQRNRPTSPPSRSSQKQFPFVRHQQDNPVHFPVTAVRCSDVGATSVDVAPTSVQQKLQAYPTGHSSAYSPPQPDKSPVDPRSSDLSQLLEKIEEETMGHVQQDCCGSCEDPAISHQQGTSHPMDVGESLEKQGNSGMPDPASCDPCHSAKVIFAPKDWTQQRQKQFEHEHSQQDQNSQTSAHSPSACKKMETCRTERIENEGVHPFSNGAPDVRGMNLTTTVHLAPIDSPMFSAHCDRSSNVTQAPVAMSPSTPASVVINPGSIKAIFDGMLQDGNDDNYPEVDDIAAGSLNIQSGIDFETYMNGI